MRDEGKERPKNAIKGLNIFFFKTSLHGSVGRDTLAALDLISISLGSGCRQEI